jgi:hypothetical protein
MKCDQRLQHGERATLSKIGSLSELINKRGRSVIQIIERMPLTIIINRSHQYLQQTTPLKRQIARFLHNHKNDQQKLGRGLVLGRAGAPSDGGKQAAAGSNFSSLNTLIDWNSSRLSSAPTIAAIMETKPARRQRVARGKAAPIPDPSDEAGPFALNKEQSNENCERDGKNNGSQPRRIHLQTFDGAQYGDCRRDGAIAIEKRRAY